MKERETRVWKTSFQGRLILTEFPHGNLKAKMNLDTDEVSIYRLGELIDTRPCAGMDEYDELLLRIEEADEALQALIAE